jgi:hypothetical protein
MTEEVENKRESFLRAFEEFGKVYRQMAAEYSDECEKYWNGLSYEDKLKSFYSVAKRIHKGEIEERGSYRHVLYDTFDFDMDSYGIGMECNYLELHNSIYTAEDIDKIVEDRVSKKLAELLPEKQVDKSEKSC